MTRSYVRENRAKPTLFTVVGGREFCALLRL